MSLSIKIYIDGVLAKTEEGLSLPSEGSSSEERISGISYTDANTGLSWSGTVLLKLIRTDEKNATYSSGDYSGHIKGSFLRIGTVSFPNSNGLWILGPLGIAPWDEEYTTGSGTYRHYASAKYDGDDDQDPETTGTPYSDGVDRRYFYSPSSTNSNFYCTFVGGARLPVPLTYRRYGGEIPCEGEALYRRDYYNSDGELTDFWQYSRKWKMDEIRMFFYLPKAKVQVGSNPSNDDYYYAMPLGNVSMPPLAGLQPPADSVFKGWQWNGDLSAVSDGDGNATTPWPFNAGDNVTIEDCFTNKNITDYREYRLQPDKTDKRRFNGDEYYRRPLRRNSDTPTARSETGLPTKVMFGLYPLWHVCTHKIVVDGDGHPVVTADGKLIRDD